MFKSYETKKYSADKIALFGFLVFALLIAGLIVRIKKAIVYSEPIKLNHTGLSVSVPAGNGWKSEMQWKFHENTFLLYSIFNADLSGTTVFVSCRYHLAIPATDKNDPLNQKVESLGGTILKTGQIQNGSLTIDWAQIKTNSADSKITIKKHLQKNASAVPRIKIKEIILDNLFYATAQLPDNRLLDIEVSQSNNYDMAEKVFGQIVKRLVFENNKLLSAGNDVVSKIKETGLSRFLENQNKQNFFVIKNAKERNIGFTMDVFVDTPQKAPLNIQAANYVYIRKRLEQNTSFNSDDKFENFEWESETTDMAGSSGSKITFNDGLLTVRNFGPDAEKQNYQPGPAAIPDVFFDFIFPQMLDYNYSKFIVDIIDADGTIIPTLFSKISNHSLNEEDKSLHAIKIKLLNRPDSSQNIYLNDKKQIVKKVLLHEGITFEATTVENILKLIPESAKYILQQNETEN